MSACVICKDVIDFDQRDTYAQLTERGCIGINKATEQRNYNLDEVVFCESMPQYVHKKCRIKYVNIKDIEKSLKEKASTSDRDNNQRKLRSRVEPFDYKTCCILCGNFVDQTKAWRDPTRKSLQFSCVLCLEVQNTLKGHCTKRQDGWAEAVRARLVAINDLPAEEAMYHRNCFSNFAHGQDIPYDKQDSDVPCKKPKLGRPKVSSKNDAFKLAMSYLEDNDDETLTIEQLYSIMKEKSGLNDDDLYSPRQLQRELKEHYGTRVSMTTTKQQSTIVTLTSNVKTIIQEAHSSAANANENNMDGLIETVGKYIRREIKCMEKHENIYPDAEQIGSIESNVNYLPPSLCLLLQTIIKSNDAKLKIASIGQAIMQSMCPRAFLPPLQVGLCVTLEHRYGHKELVNMVSKLGFCLSYTEGLLFRRNAAATHGVDVIDEVSGSFCQYQADNIDHDTRTMDGSGTVHVMGQMATFTPAIKASRTIKREKVTMEDLKKIGHVKIVPQDSPKPSLKNMVFTKLGPFSRDEMSGTVDILWEMSLFCPSPKPLWSGCMQMLHTDLPNPGKSSEIFLPVVNLTPSDPTCVRSTLEYMADHAKRHHITPIVTFDQQLWWIANMIIESQPHNSPLREIILVLGGFHTEMSFLGTIGYLMAGSGLKEAMQQVYADGSVESMLSGKAVSRAVRAHFLIDRALSTLALSDCFSIPVPRVTDKQTDEGTPSSCETSQGNVICYYVLWY